MPGRKPGLAVDALGLIIAVVVMAASATDNQVGVALLNQVVKHRTGRNANLPPSGQPCIDGLCYVTSSFWTLHS